LGIELHNNNLIACGGGGGGGGGSTKAAKAAKKAKQTKAKLSFKRRALSKAAAAGEDTSKLEAEIAELEAIVAK
jgi:ribose 1,5-bisphosphokinase PhnN